MELEKIRTKEDAALYYTKYGPKTRVLTEAKYRAFLTGAIWQKSQDEANDSLKQHNLKLTECLGEMIADAEIWMSKNTSLIAKAKSLIK